ncbi:hypothetical protein BDW42DRAFT_84537 [Aspergillus taichungensis]|uniref:Uncharacterized protein n=1 Tax=Aspergillus taichungensis TaxID=482145 RepID=A0A2J5HY28_9EURO|nr:hypothetical protein BDW42DRAFT_84537 [Aspergillus taichungensis]
MIVDREEDLNPRVSTSPCRSWLFRSSSRRDLYIGGQYGAELWGSPGGQQRRSWSGTPYRSSLLFQIGHSPPRLGLGFSVRLKQNGWPRLRTNLIHPMQCASWPRTNQELKRGICAVSRTGPRPLGDLAMALSRSFDVFSVLFLMFFFFGHTFLDHGAVTLPGSPWRTRLQSPSLKGSCMR